MLLQVEEVDQTSDHHTDHCSTPVTKELLSRAELHVEGPVMDDLRPPATKRLQQEGSSYPCYTHTQCTDISILVIGQN